MVLQLCPVLGDHKYSARVSTVLGQRFLLPAESTTPQRQVPEPTCLLQLGVGWGTGVGSISGYWLCSLGLGGSPLGCQSYLWPYLAVWP